MDQSESREDSVLGTVYCVKVLAVNREEKSESVEQTLMEREQQVSRAKGKKKGAGQVEDASTDAQAWMVPLEDASKGQAAHPKSAASKPVAEAKALAKHTVAQGKQIAKLASKAIALITPTLQKVQSALRHATGVEQTQLQEAEKQLGLWNKASRDALHSQEVAPELPIPQLPYDLVTLKGTLQAANEAAGEANQIKRHDAKQRKEQAALAKAAAPPAAKPAPAAAVTGPPDHDIAPAAETNPKGKGKGEAKAKAKGKPGSPKSAAEPPAKRRKDGKQKE